MDLGPDEIEIVERLVRLGVPRRAVRYDAGSGRGGSGTTSCASTAAARRTKIVGRDANAEKCSGVVCSGGTFCCGDQGVRRDRRGPLRRCVRGGGGEKGSGAQQSMCHGCTCGPSGARCTISMRVPQGSVMYVTVFPAADLRGGSSSL